MLNQQLCDKQGRRKYFTDEERTAFLEASSRAPREVRSFCGILLYTGCRISEALALTAKDIDLSAKAIVFETLKKRKRGMYRRVPVPSELLDSLDMIHGLRQLQRKGRLNARLWPWCRMTHGARSRQSSRRPVSRKVRMHRRRGYGMASV
jgi:integrase/recombinase XerD